MEGERYMDKNRSMPLGILLFLLFLVITDFIYFILINFTSGIFAYHGYAFDKLTEFHHILITAFLIVLIALALYFICLGFIAREKWVRKFTMIFIAWSAVWPVWGIIVGDIVFEHVVLLLIFILEEIYLMSSYVKDYFKEAEIFRYGEWTLYVRNVRLKNDPAGERPIYFFSKKVPKSGKPTALPEGYEVGVSDRSGMPYLQKIGKEKPYKYGDYTLYTRKVKLKGGKEVDIYFFSSHKPKSGKPSPMPEGYEVRVNKRSKMPYLRKKRSKK